ncbi:MAG: HutD family protein [Ilumatobacteraceae bacterium]
MFRILTADDHHASRWKNGGGVTREIARHTVGDGWHWRISIAEVSSDGPFSIFDGMSRILTVIEGDGVDLHSSEGTTSARLGEPVRFSGDLPIECRLVNGPIRDLNVIYDASAVDASVSLLEGPEQLALGPGQGGCLALEGRVGIDESELPVGAFALGTSGRIVLEHGASALLVRLGELPHRAASSVTASRRSRARGPGRDAC